MSRISPVFLSRVVSLLSKMAEGSRPGLTRPHGRDVNLGKTDRKEELKSNLQRRFSDLRNAGEDTDAQGARVLVQEIMVWEFGSNITEYESFESIVNTVTEALVVNSDTKNAVARLIREYSE